MASSTLPHLSLSFHPALCARQPIAPPPQLIKALLYNCEIDIFTSKRVIGGPVSIFTQFCTPLALLQSLTTLSSQMPTSHISTEPMIGLPQCQLRKLSEIFFFFIRLLMYVTHWTIQTKKWKLTSGIVSVSKCQLVSLSLLPNQTVL